MHITSEIKEALEKLEIRPNKLMGQHFLISGGIYRSAVEALDIKKGDKIIEIGAGLGTLTKFLLEADTEVIAIEKDKKLFEYLEEKFANHKQLEIINADVLNLNVDSLFMAGNYAVIGNIPYYLTTHLIRIMLEKWPRPKRIVLMLQREIADRISASPPKMTLLANLVQFHAKVKKIRNVPPQNFLPPPKVDSSLVLISPVDISDHHNPESMFNLIEVGFKHKRKQLAPQLAEKTGQSVDAIKELLIKTGLKADVRAEALDLKEWKKLAEILNN